MIIPAHFVKNQVTDQLNNCRLDDKYKYYWASSYCNFNLEILDSDWMVQQFASVNEEKEVTGYFEFRLDRGMLTIDSINLISFTKGNNITLSRGFLKKLDELFKYGFRKATFTVLIGNPAEKLYDNLVKINPTARVVGIHKYHIKIPTGEVCDQKIYEFLNPEIYKENN